MIEKSSFWQKNGWLILTLIGVALTGLSLVLAARCLVAGHAFDAACWSAALVPGIALLLVGRKMGHQSKALGS